MKMTQITTLALLGLAATAFVDAAAAKPGNGRGQGIVLWLRLQQTWLLRMGLTLAEVVVAPVAPQPQRNRQTICRWHLRISMVRLVEEPPVLCLPVFNARLSGVMGCLPAYNARLSGVMDCLPACVGNAPST